VFDICKKLTTDLLAKQGCAEAHLTTATDKKLLDPI
jgi:hypothetical protein